MDKSADPAADADAIVARWIEQHIGPVRSLERQGRWRPAWFAEAAGPDGPVALYVRGDRGGDVLTQPQPLSFELKVQQLFLESGLKVPRIHGYIDEIPAIVMDRVPGQADLRSAGGEAELQNITSQFIDQMILMHDVDPVKMEACGAPRPADAEALTLAYYSRIEPLFEATRGRPEPLITFLRGWIVRNVPPAENRAWPIAVDAGQFIFEGSELTAMLDFEFAALGDYHADLAALRLRNRLERIGDLDWVYAEYARRSGRPVDPQRLRFHTVIKGVVPPMHMAGFFAKPAISNDYVQSMIWNAVWLRSAVENIAEIHGWPAEPFIAPPAAARPPSAAIVDWMAMDVDALPVSDELSGYKRWRHLRALRYLQRAADHEAALDHAYLSDVTALLGYQPATRTEADAALEAYVATAGPEDDERLVRLFWRQMNGQCFLLADPLDKGAYEMLTTPLPPVKV